MKRKFSFCEKCHKFEWFKKSNTYYCWNDLYSTEQGNRFTTPIERYEWETMNIPSNCEMKAEYLIEEWNDEKG